MPLNQFKCSICGAEAPAELLKHGKFPERMSWLRNHYKVSHPRQFAQMKRKSQRSRK